MGILSKMLVVGVLFAISLSVFADDSSFPRIQVKGINPGPMKNEDSISFYGKNTEDFFKMLPAIDSVDLEWDALNAQVNRVLVLQSNNYDLVLACSKGKVETTFDKDEKATNKVVFNKDGLTTCTVKFDKNPIREGDATDFKPIDAVTGKK